MKKNNILLILILLLLCSCCKQVEKEYLITNKFTDLQKGNTNYYFVLDDYEHYSYEVNRNDYYKYKIGDYYTIIDYEYGAIF